MHRGFETSTRRRQRPLDGRWEFVTDPGDAGRDARYHRTFPSDDADRIPVPGSWNARLDYADYVGPAWYRRTFHLPSATGVMLRFPGVGGAVDVYLDGERVTGEDDGRMGLRTFKPELDAGEHELVLRVDNRPSELPLGDPAGVPHGGLHRAPILEELPPLYVSDLSVEYELEDGDALVEAEVTVHNIGHHTENREITVAVGDETVSGTVPVDGRDASMVTLPILLEDVDHWTPASPTLYDVVVRLDPVAEDAADAVAGFSLADDGGGDEADDGGVPAAHDEGGGEDGESDGDAEEDANDAVDTIDADALETVDEVDAGDVDESTPPGQGDEWRERIGFREVSVEGREILVDGEPIELAAVTCQEYHPDWGVGQPLAIQQHDLDVLQAATVEAVRCPELPHPRLLDLCDEAGILVVEGFGIRDVDPTAIQGGLPLQTARRRLTQTIRRDRHHPSVIAWELVDDCPTTEQPVRDVVGQLRGIATGVDDTRPVTLTSTADWRDERDLAYEVCDVLSVADDRSGGDGGHDAEAWTATLDRVANHYDEKPIVVSSFAGAPTSTEDGGDGGTADAEWSETVQADRIEELIGTFRDHGTVAGFAVWQFCDTPSDVSGIVTAYREPKEAVGRLASVLGTDEDGED